MCFAQADLRSSTRLKTDSKSHLPDSTPRKPPLLGGKYSRGIENDSQKSSRGSLKKPKKRYTNTAPGASANARRWWKAGARERSAPPATTESPGLNRITSPCSLLRRTQNTTLSVFSEIGLAAETRVCYVASLQPSGRPGALSELPKMRVPKQRAHTQTRHSQSSPRTPLKV